MHDLSFLAIPLPEDVEREIRLGNFQGAIKIMRKLSKRELPSEFKMRMEYEMERLKRIKKDFPWNKEKALEIAEESIENFENEEFDKWVSSGLVERMIIDGEERFYDRFVENLFFLEPSIKKRRKKKDELGDYSQKLIKDAIKRINNGEIRKYRVVAGIKLRVKRRGTYRVWLPIPKENFQIEKVRILKAYPGKYEIADNSALQRTIYFNSNSKEYQVEFEYVIREVRGGIDGYADINENLKEKLPHVRFTPYIKSLEEKITDGAEDDYEKAKRIYDWITHNTNYTYVREYCTYNNISEFVSTSLRGDCGMFALLFITLARAAGIPAKWQSGWYITPKFASPHDWAQVYVDGKWFPVDASFGNYRKNKKERNAFYFGNLDAFRMIANDDFQVDFIPEKKYWRSDPVDNQRGEVEIEKRNLYFDEFNSHLYAKEFERV